MSFCKYVMDGDNRFVMINKYSGLEHSQLALLLEGDPVSAGFVTIMDGALVPYGQSISLGMKIRKDIDQQIMNDALNTGQIHIKWDDVTDQYFASNITHLSQGEVVEDVQLLAAKRIVENF